LPKELQACRSNREQEESVATTIRLTRLGKKKRPFYRLVVVDSRTRRDSSNTAQLGYYDPFRDPYECKVDAQATIQWLERGAGLSLTARSLLRNEGILYRWHLQKQGIAAAEIDAKVEAFRAQRVRKLEVAKLERKRKSDEHARQHALAAKKKKDEAAAAKAAAEPASADGEASA
jgi:small subunit ribosomal protein S16